LPQLILEGKVFSGKGTGKSFIDLPWVKSQIQNMLDFTPYSGTLNIQLTQDSKEKRKNLNPAKGMMVEPEKGYYSGVLFKAAIDTLNCAVVIPVTPNYPSDVLEIISPLYLRGQLGLTDGSLVAVAVTF
jgi:riboflavin kinase, archaea type